MGIRSCLSSENWIIVSKTYNKVKQIRVYEYAPCYTRYPLKSIEK